MNRERVERNCIEAIKLRDKYRLMPLEKVLVSLPKIHSLEEFDVAKCIALQRIGYLKTAIQEISFVSPVDETLEER
ncbi:hypothetical protein SAMN02910355_0279 [Terrisporobacter glycolicus]|nr:hypothetical protein SAMN02910355_0279 [Terrisporobacter glycolicus]